MKLLVAGLLPSEGSISVDGTPLTTCERQLKSRLGYLPQQFGLYDELTVWQFLDYFTERNNVRLPAYHRLDLGINIYRPKKNGHLGIWNISVYNAYCQMNPITIHKRSWINYSHYFETLSLLPIIPSISYTYKF